MDLTDTQVAEILEGCIPIIQRYVRVLRGEEEDLTGRGLQRILLSRLERALGVKVRKELRR